MADKNAAQPLPEAVQINGDVVTNVLLSQITDLSRKLAVTTAQLVEAQATIEENKPKK